jgi:two-component system, OmpR family, KDP operon response regulator KdpE
MATPLATRILVIDDEPAIRKLLRVSLESNGYNVIDAPTAADGLREAAAVRPDIIILDLGLPDMGGDEFIRRLREWSTVPIIVLTVRDSEADKVAVLDAGADDYLTKPFSAAELQARVRVALRHSHPGEDSAIFVSGPLQVDYAARRVTLDGKQIHLTATEYSLLLLLSRHAGKVVTHSQILREILGPGSEEQRHYLRVYFGQLRKKLDSGAGAPQLILTEPGIGYRIQIIE